MADYSSHTVTHQCTATGRLQGVQHGQLCQFCHRQIFDRQMIDYADGRNFFPEQYPPYPPPGHPGVYVPQQSYHQYYNQGYDRGRRDLPPRESIGFGHPQTNGSYPYFNQPTAYQHGPAVTTPPQPTTRYDVTSDQDSVQHQRSQRSPRDEERREAGSERRSSNQNSASKVHCEICRNMGKEALFGREADKNRHVDSVHNKGKRWDCTWEGCERKDVKAFTRKDHLQDHIRQVHDPKLPKKRPGRGRKESKSDEDDEREGAI